MDTVYVWANLPRAVFWKRDCAPLVRISFRIPEYRVAAGVLPAGEVQRPLVAIAAIISWQFNGSAALASTKAAALSALSLPASSRDE